MSQVLYTTDTTGKHTIPVVCERVNWRNCPQHKHLKPNPDNTAGTSSMPDFGTPTVGDGVSFNDYKNHDSTVAGYDMKELFAAGFTTEELIELKSKPPQGSKQQHSWSSALLETEKTSSNSDSFTPSYVKAEALMEETQKMNREKHTNLSDNNNERVQILQDGGEKYYQLASIVADDNEGTYTAATKTAAENVLRKTNHMGNKQGTPLVKHPQTGLWEIDPDVAALTQNVKTSLNNLSETKKQKRDKTVQYFETKSVGYNAYEDKGLPVASGLNVSTDPATVTGRLAYFPSKTAKQASEKLVNLRIKTRLLEKELNNLNKNKPKGLQKIFQNRNHENMVDKVQTELTFTKNNLNAAETE